MGAQIIGPIHLRNNEQKGKFGDLAERSSDHCDREKVSDKVLWTHPWYPYALKMEIIHLFSYQKVTGFQKKFV